MPVTQNFLNQDEFFSREIEKDKIFIHHTAGNHNPNSTKNWWEHPRSHPKVATAYIIGGKSLNGDTRFDGEILQVMPEKCWAYHLGIGGANDIDMNSIAIEICNAGYVYPLPQGFYSPALRDFIPKEDVIKLDKPFRGHQFYHKYTHAQLDALRELTLAIADRHTIDLNKGLKAWIPREQLTIPENLTSLQYQVWLNEKGFVGKNGDKLLEDGVLGAQTFWASQSVGKEAFEFNTECYSGRPGLWTHTNVRDRLIDLEFEKSDCSPQPELKAMIMSL